MRKDREWSQSDLAEVAKTSRTVITRIEDPNYGKLTLKTLFAIASAFDVALLVKFVPFSRLVKEYEDVSWQVLAAPSVTDPQEVAKLEAWSADSVAPKPVILAGLRTDKGAGKAALIKRYIEHFTIELEKESATPTVIIEGENTEKAA
jgi:transcriptional regulator with XRE-family HTH domain